MRFKDRLVRYGLVAGALYYGSSSQIEYQGTVETKGGCSVTIYESKFLIEGGRTYPAANFSNALIFVHPDPSPLLMKHEMGHADQLCEKGFGAVKDWIFENEAHKEDATKRGEKY